MPARIGYITLLMVFLLSAAGCRTAQKTPAKPEAIKRPEFRLYTQLPPDVELLTDIEYGKGGSRPLRLNILRPKNQPSRPMPAIVWIHGGSWIAGTKDDLMVNFSGYAQQGYVFASIEYRLSSEAVFPAQIEDCKCAVRFLRANAGKYNIDAGRIGVWGASAGGYLAALLGTSGGVKDLEGSGGWPDYSSRVQAVCDWFGPTDFYNITTDAKHPVALLLGGPPQNNREKALKASVTPYATRDDPPFLIMHGDKDDVVPLEASEILDTALKNAGVESTFNVIKGAGHGFGGLQEFREVLDFFDKHLKGGSP